MRFIVTDVYDQGKSVACRGRVVQGFVEVGDRLVVLPVGDLVTVSKLEHLQSPSDDIDDPRRLAVAIAGDIVELAINDIDIMRLSLGNILSFPNCRPQLTKKAKAKLLVMEGLSVPIIRGAQVVFHMHSLDIPAIVTKLVAVLTRDGSIKKDRPRALTSGASAVVGEFSSFRAGLAGWLLILFFIM
jgi:elongation factor 1 alpha-like protein